MQVQGMQLGVDGVFVTFLYFSISWNRQAAVSKLKPSTCAEVGSGIFKSEDPAKRARAIVKADSLESSSLVCMNLHEQRSALCAGSHTLQGSPGLDGENEGKRLQPRQAFRSSAILK